MEEEKLNKTEKFLLKWKSLILSKYDTFISHIIHLLFQTLYNCCYYFFIADDVKTENAGWIGEKF